MKKMLINLFTPKKYKEKFSLCQGILKGRKAYLAGAIMILQGVSLMLDTVVDFATIGDFINWCGSALLSDGGILISQGLAIMGVRAGVAKISK